MLRGSLSSHTVVQNYWELNPRQASKHGSIIFKNKQTKLRQPAILFRSNTYIKYNWQDLICETQWLKFFFFPQILSLHKHNILFPFFPLDKLVALNTIESFVFVSICEYFGRKAQPCLYIRVRLYLLFVSICGHIFFILGIEFRAKMYIFALQFSQRIKKVRSVYDVNYSLAHDRSSNVCQSITIIGWFILFSYSFVIILNDKRER